MGIYNRGQNSLGHLRNVADYLYFTTEVWKRAVPLQKRVAVSSPHPRQLFHIIYGGGARLGRWSCIRDWPVRKSVKIANLYQDISPWLQVQLAPCINWGCFSKGTKHFCWEKSCTILLACAILFTANSRNCKECSKENIYGAMHSQHMQFFQYSVLNFFVTVQSRFFENSFFGTSR